MDSDNILTNTVFHTNSQFNNSDIETPDEFVDSEISPSTFSQRPFNPSILKSPKNLPQPLPPTLNPNLLSNDSDPLDHSSTVDTELENELDNFITL